MLGIKDIKKITIGATLGLLLSAISPVFAQEEEEGSEVHHPTEMTQTTRKVPYDRKAFRPDPNYEDKPYDPEAQLKIYGAKFPVETPKPLIELGRKLYDSGPLPEAFTFFGVKNPIIEHFMVFGDFKIAVAYNDGFPDGINENTQQARAAVQLNLELDLAITATERFHALVQPLNQVANFTVWDFEPGQETDFDTNTDFNFDTLFFEGDLGAILSGILNKDMGFDLAFAVGLMPLLFHNGIWVEDAFTGAAVTIPALNSPALDISNMDITFFVGLDDVNSAAQPLVNGDVNDQDAKIFAVNFFVETMQGYWEIGYGYHYDASGLGDADYHNLMVSFTRRYGGIVSNSFRVLYNFGQKRPDVNAGRDETADGVLILIENSLISSQPLVLVPYLNLFAGFNKPQSLARAGAAGGVLKNTGLAFEKENLSFNAGVAGFPFLNDTAEDAYGGALGIEYICDPFNLDPDRQGLNGQIVVEAAMVRQLEGGENAVLDRTGDQYALSVRLQQPISQATILRMDAIYVFQEDEEDVSGVRFEIRRKF